MIDLSSPPRLQPLLGGNILSWARSVASAGEPFASLQAKGLDFLEKWEELSAEEREVVGEIMSALFRVEDLGEPSEKAQQVAQGVLRDTPTTLDELAHLASTQELIDPLLIWALASFAFSTADIDLSELGVVLNYCLQDGSNSAFPHLSRALAQEGLIVFEAVKRSQDVNDLIKAKWTMALLLARLHPTLVKAAPAIQPSS